MQHLQLLLSDLIVLSQKARSYHWNVTGPLFYTWHDVYGKLYDDLSEKSDTVAERIRALSETPVSTLAQALGQTHIVESSSLGTTESMRDEIVHDLETVVGHLSAGISSDTDEVTKDLLIEISGDLEKTLWMLRSTQG